MTAYTGSSSPRRSLLGLVAAALHSRSRSQTGRPSRVAAMIQDHALTVAAIGLIDAGGFLTLHRGGWFVAGLSLLILDLKLQG